MSSSRPNLENYQVKERLDGDSGGSLGEAWLAVSQVSGQLVVLKHVYPHVAAAPSFAPTLQKCAELSATKGPVNDRVASVVAVHARGQDQLYIVSAYTPGCSLRNFVHHHKKIPAEYAIYLTQQILAALSALRSSGFTFHGHLHPGNIVISNDYAADGHKKIILTDYYLGIALQEYNQARNTPYAKRKTLASTVLLGDPAFLSPEQCKSATEIGEAADCYSLGMILYYLVTGIVPLANESTSSSNIIFRQIDEDPEPPRKLDPSINPEIEALILSLIGKKPAERLSLTELEANLNKCALGLMHTPRYKIQKYTDSNGSLFQYSALDRFEKDCTVLVPQIDRCVRPYEEALRRVRTAMAAMHQAALSGFRKIVDLGNSIDEHTLSEFIPYATLADVAASRAEQDTQEWTDKSLRICRRIASILSEAHSKGWLYLGLRPTSVLLRFDEGVVGGLVVKLAESETFCKTDLVAGTPGLARPEDDSPTSSRYAAPEQLSGQSSTKSDVFSLGLILCELITGSVPEPEVAPSPDKLKGVNASIDAILTKKLTGYADLSQLVWSMLDLDPQHRPSMTKVEEDLISFSDSATTQRLTLPKILGSLDLHQEPTPQVPISDRSDPTPDPLGPAAAPPKPSQSDPVSAIPDAQPKASDRHRRKVATTEDMSPGESVPSSPQFPGYKDAKIIGKGGTGVVYSAIDIVTGQLVAIKVLLSEHMQSEVQLQRFRVEHTLTTLVKHSGVVKIIGVFDDVDDKPPYIVMEFVQGDTLHQYLAQKGKLGPEEALQIAGWVTDILCSVHDAGIVHRDVKPENIILQKNASGDHSAKLLDFGIAKRLERENSTKIRGLVPTNTGAVFGTPLYMPPEQRLDSSSVTESADIFALGAILYEMLSGRRAQGEVKLRSNAYDFPKSLQMLVPDLPVQLTQFVSLMMAFEPKTRPSIHQVRTFLRAMQQLILHGYGAWLAVSFYHATTEFIRRYYVAIIVVIISCLSAGIGGTWMYSSYQKNQYNSNLADLDSKFGEQNWSYAKFQALRMLAFPGLTLEQRQYLQKIVRQAEIEETSKILFNNFNSASDAEHALAVFAAIPEVSTYKQMGTTRAAQLVEQRVSEISNDARAAAREGRCEAWQLALGKLKKFAPQSPQLRAHVAAGCKTKPAALAELSGGGSITPSVPQVAKPQPGVRPQPSVGEQRLQLARNYFVAKKYEEARRNAQLALASMSSAADQVESHLIRGRADCALLKKEGSNLPANEISLLLKDATNAASMIAQKGEHFRTEHSQLLKFCNGNGVDWSLKHEQFVLKSK